MIGVRFALNGVLGGLFGLSAFSLYGLRAGERTSALALRPWLVASAVLGLLLSAVALALLAAAMMGTPPWPVDRDAIGMLLDQPGIGTAWKLRQRGDEFRVLSPVDGEVLETGSPDDGFLLKVRTEGVDTHLLRGAEVQPWVMRELERLQVLIAPDPNAPALADGGVLVDDAPEAFPEANWAAVWGEMLLEP